MPDVDIDGEDDDSELKCSECEKKITEEDDVSSFCGSICEDCAVKHAKACGVCRKDFLERGVVEESDLE